MAGREGRPSPALVISLISLAVALSGTAMALPGKNTVNSGDIVNKQVKPRDLAVGAVKAPKLAANSVRSAKIRDGEVSGADIAPDTITRSDLAPGAVWASELGAIHERSATTSVPAGQDKSATAECLPNEQVISGGAGWGITTATAHLEQSHRTGNGWRVWGANTGASANDLIAYAYCLQGPIQIPIP